jgi:hypothetical protein
MGTAGLNGMSMPGLNDMGTAGLNGMSMPGLNGVRTPGRGRAEAGRALFGRRRELNVLDGLVDGIGDRGAALLVQGPAGIGKSALLTVARAAAVSRGIQVLTVTGVQSETHLPFAALHQLIRSSSGETV